MSTSSSVSPFDWKHHITLLFDSVSCKGLVVVNYHTNKIVGLGVDYMRSKIIKKALKELESCNASD